MTLFEEWRDHRPTPERLILDADSTWDETHGAQQLTFFDAHYDSYGPHPILVFDGETGDLIVAHLRPGNVGAAEGIVAWLEGLAEGIRAKWPDVPILLRADAGFATPSVCEWRGANGVDYLIGLGINKRLAMLSAANLEAAKAEYLSGNMPGGNRPRPSRNSSTRPIRGRRAGASSPRPSTARSARTSAMSRRASRTAPRARSTPTTGGAESRRTGSRTSRTPSRPTA